VAHIHGGELTEGAIDDAIRHVITKMSHLHFVATETYRRRVIQLGEEPWRVAVSGAPGLDNVLTMDLVAREDLEARLGLNMSRPFLIVTFHPVTLEHENTDTHLNELLRALADLDYGLVFTYPNADTGSRAIIDRIRRFATGRPNATLVDNLGTAAYFGLMKHAAAMVGNSSSGIIEAGSFKLPVVNIGSRQQGRTRGRNVVDVECSRERIVAAIRTATSKAFAAGLADLVNPYGDGHAARRIVEVLRSVPMDARLITKPFHDLESVSV
jgi:UDP-N-acetylglucosamine 2-epimerase (non-hydrolysing)/GDP/UDP-N,N'-diacetylbacillosamine 2-epimerase (hydrolysing)